MLSAEQAEKPHLTYRDFLAMTGRARRPTVGDLIRRYKDEMGVLTSMSPTPGRVLNRLLDAPIARVVAEDLGSSHIVAHCRERAQEGAGPATVAQDLIYLRGPLAIASVAWEMPAVTTRPIEDAKPLLKKLKLIGASAKRSRRPEPDELELLTGFFAVQDKDRRSEIKMVTVINWQIESTRRISETCRILRKDVNAQKRTCIVRDMKDPRNKKGNDFEWPLIEGQWGIVQAQPKTDDPRIFPWNHGSVSTRWSRATKALGIEDLHLHDLRREGISRLFEKGYSPDEVAMVSGHKTLDVLWRVYTKLKPESLHQGPRAARLNQDRRQ